MATFSLDVSQTGKRLIKRKLWTLLIFSIPLLIDSIYPNEIIRSGYGYIVLGFFIGSCISDFSRIVVYRVDFDNSAKQIKVVFKTPFGKPAQRELSFSEARLDVYSKKHNGRREIYAIDFMKGKREVASITGSKEGFNAETLYHMLRTAEELNITNRVT